MQRNAEGRAAAWLRGRDASGVHRTGWAGDHAGAAWLAAGAKSLGANVSAEALRYSTHPQPVRMASPARSAPPPARRRSTSPNCRRERSTVAPIGRCATARGTRLWPRRPPGWVSGSRAARGRAVPRAIRLSGLAGLRRGVRAGALAAAAASRGATARLVALLTPGGTRRRGRITRSGTPASRICRPRTEGQAPPDGMADCRRSRHARREAKDRSSKHSPPTQPCRRGTLSRHAVQPAHWTMALAPHVPCG